MLSHLLKIHFKFSKGVFVNLVIDSPNCHPMTAEIVVSTSCLRHPDHLVQVFCPLVEGIECTAHRQELQKDSLIGFLWGGKGLFGLYFSITVNH